MDRDMFVGLFSSPGAAQNARRELIDAGIPDSDISVHSGEAPGNVPFILTDYGEDLRRGAAVLRVNVDGADRERVVRVFEHHGLGRTGEERHKIGEPSAAPATVAAKEPPVTTEALHRPAPTVEVTHPSATAEPRHAAAAVPEPEETIIQTASEELEVGKRPVTETRRFRVRRYVTEHAVEQPVQLHDETVIVERRSPHHHAGHDRPFEEKVIEVTEIHEEPVVRKVVQPGEEVVIRKEVRDHLETVRETVRESKVAIEDAAGNEPLRAPKEAKPASAHETAGDKSPPKRR